VEVVINQNELEKVPVGTRVCLPRLGLGENNFAIPAALVIPVQQAIR